MSTHLILLVGTNPLPVWVAWEQLKGRLEQPVSLVTLVHTAETEYDACQIKKRIGKGGPEVRLWPTAAGAPEAIYRDVAACLTDEQLEGTHTHIHYTGGTKVMAVHSIKAVAESLTQGNWQTSYLYPRGSEGPCIVDGDGNTIGNNDARIGIHLNADVLASLHGFEIGPFPRGARTIPVPNPAPETSAATLLLDTLVRNGCRGKYLGNKRKKIPGWLNDTWRPALTDLKRPWPSLYSLPATSRTVRAPHGVTNWPAIAREIDQELCGGLGAFDGNGEFHIPSSGSPGIGPEQLEAVDSFLDGGWLERAAFAKLEKALKGTGRTNFNLYHSATFQRTGSRRAQTFELDVVAILGYQVLVVSCGVTGKEKEVKLKGFEALARARQIGGDEARAILLCLADPGKARTIEEDLHRDIGGKDKPLEVWGIDTWPQLDLKFVLYRNQKLKWS